MSWPSWARGEEAEHLSPNPVEFDTTDFYVKTPPAVEPVTLDEVKLFAKVDGSAEDTLLETFISAARTAIESILGRSLINQTLVLRMDEWPCNVLRLPRPPLVSIVEVRTLDEDNTATVYAAANYYTRDGDTAELVIRSGCSAPSNTTRYKGGYEVEWIAGYGDAGEDVPAGIRQAILLWVASAYENRKFDEANPPAEVAAKLSLYRVVRI